MYRRIVSQLCLTFAVMVCVGTTAASTPAACTGRYCTYLPLVSTPELVSLSDVGLYGSRFGDSVVITAEVNTTTSTPVYSVTLEVRSYDSENNLLGTGTGSPAFVATLPGQPNPFYGSLYVGSEDLASRTEVRVLGFSRTHPHTFLPVRVTVTSYKNYGDRIELTGTLTNENTVPLEDIRGVAWMQDGGDQRRVRSFAPRLEPFETIPFSTSIGPVNLIPGTEVPYKVVAQGVVP